MVSSEREFAAQVNCVPRYDLRSGGKECSHWDFRWGSGMLVSAARLIAPATKASYCALVYQVFGDATLGGSAELAAASDIIFLGVRTGNSSAWHTACQLGSLCLCAWTMHAFRGGKLLRCCVTVVQVKPQYLDGVLEALAPHITPRHLVVSIAAGVRLASLEGRLPEGTRVVGHTVTPHLFWTHIRTTTQELVSECEDPGKITDQGMCACADPSDAEHAMPHWPGGVCVCAGQPRHQ